MVTVPMLNPSGQHAVANAPSRDSLATIMVRIAANVSQAEAVLLNLREHVAYMPVDGAVEPLPPVNTCHEQAYSLERASERIAALASDLRDLI